MSDDAYICLFVASAYFLYNLVEVHHSMRHAVWVHCTVILRGVLGLKTFEDSKLKTKYHIFRCIKTKIFCGNVSTCTLAFKQGI